MDVSGQFHAPTALSRGKEPPVLTEEEGGPQSWSGRNEEKEYVLALTEIDPRFLGSSPSSLLSIQMSYHDVCWLSYLHVSVTSLAAYVGWMR
jgi:hypothetical protein